MPSFLYIFPWCTLINSQQHVQTYKSNNTIKFQVVMNLNFHQIFTDYKKAHRNLPPKNIQLINQRHLHTAAEEVQKSTKNEGEEAFGKGMKMIRNHVTDQLLTGFCPSPLAATTALSIGDQLTIIRSAQYAQLMRHVIQSTTFGKRIN